MKPRTIVSVLESTTATNDAALMQALLLAQWYESDLHVVAAGPVARAEDDSPGASHDALVARIGRVTATAGGRAVAITATVLPGRPVGAIADYTARVDADLVVVGKDVRRSHGYWSAGSFAAAIGTAVSAPTIAAAAAPARPAGPVSPFRHILTAIDFSEVSFLALSEALALAQESGGQLRLLHVLDGFPFESAYSGSEALRLINEFRARMTRVNRALGSLIPPEALNWADIDVSTVSGSAHGAIVAAAAERPTDLIVLGLPRRRRLEQLVAGSTAHKVVRRASAPVLLVPGPATASLFNPADDHGGLLVRHPAVAAWQAVDSAEVAQHRT